MPRYGRQRAGSVLCRHRLAKERRHGRLTCRIRVHGFTDASAVKRSETERCPSPVV